MAFEYVNRRGERYYLHQGTTKTGKPKYFVSRKADGVLLDGVPEGYEIYEAPERGIVAVRKVRTSRVLPGERESLRRWTGELAGIKYYLVDVEGDSLVIYTPGTDPARAVAALSMLFGAFPGGAVAEQEGIARHASYHPMLRFTLVDEQKRLFEAERWCFRGAIDDWFPISGSGSLEALARKYLPHLNQESFFELM